MSKDQIEFSRLSFAYDEGFFKKRKQFRSQKDMIDCYSIFGYVSPSDSMLLSLLRLAAAQALDYKYYLKRLEENDENLQKCKSVLNLTGSKPGFKTLRENLTSLILCCPEQTLEEVFLYDDPLLKECMYNALLNISGNRRWNEGDQRIINISAGKISGSYINDVVRQRYIGNLFSFLEFDGNNPENSEIFNTGFASLDFSNSSKIPKNMPLESFYPYGHPTTFRRNFRNFYSWLRADLNGDLENAKILDRTCEMYEILCISTVENLANKLNFSIPMSFTETPIIPDEEKFFPLCRGDLVYH